MIILKCFFIICILTIWDFCTKYGKKQKIIFWIFLLLSRKYKMYCRFFQLQLQLQLQFQRSIPIHIKSDQSSVVYCCVMGVLCSTS